MVYEESGDIVPNGYIVTLKPHLSQADIDSHCARIEQLCSQAAITADVGLGDAGKGLSTFAKFAIGDIADVGTASVDDSSQFSAVRGYGGIFSEEVLADITNSHEVAKIEPDRFVRPLTTVIQPLPAPAPGYVWNLSRISHRGRFNSANNEYKYDNSQDGDKVSAYVIDTGVLLNHMEFGVRAIYGTNIVPGSMTDTDGHGTHVAGTIGGKTYGVAKKTTIVSVKVYPDTPGQRPRTTTTALIQGLEWAVRHASNNGGLNKSVANISSGGSYVKAFNDSVAAAVRLGMVVVVAAGNDGADALGYSPASAPEAVTVGATDIMDGIPSWSNWGRIVDILAPGVNIISAWHTSNTAINTLSGTSMASPLVAGIACSLREGNSFPTAGSVIRKIKSLGERNSATIPPTKPGTINLIAHI